MTCSPLDVDHHHVRIGRADVVLDHQAIAAARRGRAEAGMVELERRRALHPGHERCDQGAVAVTEAVGARAVDRFGRDLRLQPVQRLVRVHDDEVHAVAALPLGSGQPVDLDRGDAVAAHFAHGFTLRS